jgi:hypothetical protein
MGGQRVGSGRSTLLEDLASHPVDRLELARSVEIGFGGVGADPFGQTIQTRSLFVADFLPFRDRETTNGSLESPLSIEGALQAQVLADPGERATLAAQSEHLTVNRFGRVRHGVTS